MSPRALTCFTTASRSKPASSSSLNIASVSPKKPSMMRRTISRVNMGLETPWAFFCRSVMSMVVAEPWPYGYRFLACSPAKFPMTPCASSSTFTMRRAMSPSCR